MAHAHKPFRCVLCCKDIEKKSRRMHDDEEHPDMQTGAMKVYAHAGNNGQHSGWKATSETRYQSQLRRGLVS